MLDKELIQVGSAFSASSGVWTLGLSKGSYGSADIGANAFDAAFQNGKNHIVKRACASCSAAYKGSMPCMLLSLNSHRPYG